MLTPCIAGPLPDRGGRPLAEFTQDVFGSLPRADQRRWAGVYLSGLLNTPGRKTMKRIALQVSGVEAAGQALQQFITSSPWDWREPRAALARAAARCLPDHAWVTGTFVSEKRGGRSVGVHRRFVPELGATVNCQVGVGLFLASDEEAIPVDWSLVLDGGWCDDAALRRRARIPDTVGAASAWERAVGMADAADALSGAGRAPLVADLTSTGDLADVTAATAYGNREILARVRPDQPVAPARRVGSPVPGAVSTAEQLLGRGGTGRPRGLPGRYAGGGGPLRLRSAPVHLPGARQAVPGAAPPLYRLFSLGHPGGADEPQYWLSTLRRRDTGYVLSLMRRVRVVRSTVRVLGEGFGLTDFEGRSFPGWHHHMTMVSAAYTYSRLSRPVTDRLSA
ncbi:hypothetical protein GCM10010377_25010 [Streptomyces viridiviolaceus]|uniref:IS701 family transposase n=1 Tax=Streptomyces viridiviolaceus TaxID=68282 RepID=A0ABW2DR80_9ACTN|nr:transposase [Streptomyces viridiviolaceus]GHB33398.1 hypothetical protein GCM10010377_25010 [Streptomyces viridiviolaceus]